MGDSLIFVSCGQRTAIEKSLGVRIKEVIDATPGFTAYFAQTVQELEGLNRHIFDALQRCSGAVVLMHDRGPFLDVTGSERGRRSSVWVNQEIAVLAYRQFLEDRPLPVLCFAQAGITLEGAMTLLILNPSPLGSDAEVIATVKNWLSKHQFGHGSGAAFEAKWERLDDCARRVLAGLVEEGGQQVNASALKDTLRRLFGASGKDANDDVVKAALQFQNTGLVTERITDQGREFSLHPTWEPSVSRHIAVWRNRVRS